MIITRIREDDPRSDHLKWHYENHNKFKDPILESGKQDIIAKSAPSQILKPIKIKHTTSFLTKLGFFPPAL